MRCEPSPCKCCCPQPSPDSASSPVCVRHLPSAAARVLSFRPSLSSLCLPSSSVTEWFSSPAFTSVSPSLLSNVSSNRSFVFSGPPLSLFTTLLRQEDRLRSFFHSFPFFLSTPNFWFYLDILFSSSLIPSHPVSLSVLRHGP